MAAYHFLADKRSGGREITFAQLYDQVAEREIDHVRVTLEGSSGAASFLATRKDGQLEYARGVLSDTVLREFLEGGVGLDVRQSESFAAGTLIALGGVALLMLTFFLMMRRISSGTSATTIEETKKAAPRVTARGQHTLRFASIAGLAAQKAALREASTFLQGASALTGPRGVFLQGPPGSGKTWLVQALAGELDVPLLAMSGAEFLDMWVGVGAQRIRSLFTQAAAQAPCVVLIDELDAVAKKRGVSAPGLPGDEREQTLSQLLSCLDGLGTQPAKILIVGVSNRPDLIDPALLRPGRLGLDIACEAPDADTRAEILRTLAVTQPPVTPDALAALAERTAGASRAGLADLWRRAREHAAARGEPDGRVAPADLEHALGAQRTG